MQPWAEQAFDNLNSLHYWFRKKYNLPPNDERALSITDQEILVDYLTEQLEHRIELAQTGDIAITGLASLLGPLTVSEKEKAIVAEMDKKREEGALPEPEFVPAEVVEPPQEEEVITFSAGRVD